jgi:hypothetical protein
MNFDSRTLQILKNFSTINPSILFKPGSVLSTISPTKTIMARAKINESVEAPFAIYDLSRFLSTLSLFDNPELSVETGFMRIKQGARKINYTFAEPSMIVSPPEKEIKLPDPEVEFNLSAENLQELLKALSVLSLPEIAVVGDGTSIYAQVLDSKNPSGDTYSVTVGETTNTFRMIFKAENLKLIPGTYDVRISSKGLSHFNSPEVEYYIAVEASSTFEG